MLFIAGLCNGREFRQGTAKLFVAGLCNEGQFKARQYPVVHCRALQWT